MVPSPFDGLTVSKGEQAAADFRGTLLDENIRSKPEGHGGIDAAPDFPELHIRW